MSSQFLQTELLNLIQESKRKNSDLRNAAEESLNDLKALPSTSEAQISADLVRKLRFVDPFILACHSRHAKLAGIGVVCLQRLVASRSLPSERLKDVLGGLKESTSLSLDIQLKILQSLPSLLQHYSNDLGGELLASTLEICATLQASKTLAVSSTAAATLQQLVVSTFERVAEEDKTLNESKPRVSIKLEADSVNIGYSAYDALRVLDDLCRLVDGEQLHFLRIKSLSQTFTLELIESVLTNSGHLFIGHAELTHVLRTRLMPMTVRYLSERHGFALTSRVARILLILLKRHMSLLTAECEMALGLLTHLLEPDGTSPWKRVLCMEVFRGLYAEPGLVRLIYSLYDGEDNRKNILRDHMAALVRLASEKPSLIGVSSRSTVPLRAEHARSITEEQITLEAGGVAGVIGATGPSTETSFQGISSQWSTVRTPYIELLDKTDPPSPPETYIYNLVLNCITSFAEGLAKFILPLTVPDPKQKRRSRITSPDKSISTGPSHDLQRMDSGKTIHRSNSKKLAMPLNPLDLDSHPQLTAIKACAGIIENCWPAILATCSTFLYASLDEEYYHNLVRSFQKLAHVAGLLRLSVPRDAFLTTLAKATMPADVAGASTAAVSDSHSITAMDEKRKGGAVTLVSSPFPANGPKASADIASLALSTRNLLCLRALLNLGIALGPTLDQPAWSIILETLQNVDLLIGMASSKTNNSINTAGDVSGDMSKASFGAEITAVQAASAKLFESTGDYPSDSFDGLLIALLALSGMTEEPVKDGPSDSSPSQKRIGRARRKNRGVSSVVEKSRVRDEELKFVLDKAKELAQANLERLSSLVDSDRGVWQLLTESLIATAANPEISQRLRLKANGVLSYVVFETMKQRDNADDSVRNARHFRNLETLNMQVSTLYSVNASMPGLPPSTSVIEIHEQSLETLKSILEQYADSFNDAWTLVFSLISSVFGDVINGESATVADDTSSRARDTRSVANSPRLVRAAYKSLQLVASDFIALLPRQCRLDLVNSLSRFALQQEDFNISLTTTSSFWNVSDFLQGQIEEFCIESHVELSVSEETLSTLARGDEPSVSRNALWLLLLLRIVSLARDSRLEIRNCAIQTLLRIFDAYGQQLSPKAWRLCLNRVLFLMVEAIELELSNSRTAEKARRSEVLQSWIETAVVTIKGFSNLITTFFEPIVGDAAFDASWERLLGYFHKLISSNFLELSEAVFSSLANILLRAQTTDDMSKKALELAWSLWVAGHPACKEDMIDLERPNQEASSAYLQTFQQLYRLYKNDLGDDHIEHILLHLRLLAWNSISPRYSPDVDRVSDLQAIIIECVKLLCSDKPGAQPKIVFCLADFVDSALTKWSPDSDPRRPTFVAFSKSAVELLGWYIAVFGIKKDIFSNGSLTSALEHLGNPIVQRYEWAGKDRDPSLWQKSTTAVLAILYVAVPYVEKQYENAKLEEISRFWKRVVDIANGIASAKGYRNGSIPPAKIHADETFDIDAMNKLKSIIIPSLGASIIPEDIRRQFARTIFDSSFIYQQQRFGAPIKYSEKEPLEGIYDIRPGRTFDPPSTPRARMAYVLLDTLFELASAPQPEISPSNDDTSRQKTTNPEQTAARVLLSRSVSPYLILRCAVSLKAYIADQPLRGLMPQPTPARKALLHLLRGMIDLRSEPTAIPAPPIIRTVVMSSGDSCQAGNEHHKKHLEWIYPLVVKAVQVAGREKDDGEVLQVLGAVLDRVGNDI
ncbi:protein MON2 homolog [Aspergillus udagawae]|nr:protein MON2 homolog [Aspergillus udagawae]